MDNLCGSGIVHHKLVKSTSWLAVNNSLIHLLISGPHIPFKGTRVSMVTGCNGGVKVVYPSLSLSQRYDKFIMTMDRPVIYFTFMENL